MATKKKDIIDTQTKIPEKRRKKIAATVDKAIKETVQLTPELNECVTNNEQTHIS